MYPGLTIERLNYCISTAQQYTTVLLSAILLYKDVVEVPFISDVRTYVCTICIVSRCGGELWVDQRKKCADICDVAQVTDICTLPN